MFRSQESYVMHEEASTRNASPVSRPMIALLGLLLALLFSSVATNFVLAARLREAGELIAKQSPQSLKLGTPVTIIKARDLQKGPQQVGFSKLSTPTLLYVFTPS